MSFLSHSVGISAISASCSEFEPLEHVAEHAVELVEVALVLDQRGARQIVEVLDPARGEVLVHRLHQREIFAQRHRHAGGLEIMEEGDEHFGSIARPCPACHVFADAGSGVAAGLADPQEIDGTAARDCAPPQSIMW